MAHTQSLKSDSLADWKSLRLIQPSIRIRLLAKVLMFLLLVMIGAMATLPWQQTSRATGKVVAFDPTERPQTVEAPIYGRVIRWGDRIAEGVAVEQGQLVMEIADNDPERAERLAEQVAATEQKLRFANEKTKSYYLQISEYKEARSVIVESYKRLVEVATQKIEAAKQDLEAARSAERQLQLDHDRQTQLAAEGVVANLKAQEAQAKFEQAVSKRKAAESYVAAAESEQQAKSADLVAKTREANAKVQEAEAKHQQAAGEEEIAKKEFSELKSKLAQFGQRRIEAPRHGVIQRLFVAHNAQMLKEGDPLFTIVPETTQRAAEIWIDGNDVPLVQPGGEVRLQFEGWPAVQFSGWPSVAVGTFGGEVISIDGTDDGNGRFRLLVRPKPDSPWPSEQYLRQGARVNGWVMLNEVSLGYEFWRQLNGFPPAIPKSPGGDKSDDDKKKVKVKVPK